MMMVMMMMMMSVKYTGMEKMAVNLDNGTR